MKRTAAKAKKSRSEESLEDRVESAVTWLKRHSSKATRDGMARYGVPSECRKSAFT